jgi:hypothetical protein
MDNALGLFTKLLCVAVVSVLLMGGGLPFLIMVIAGYTVGMYFIDSNLK